MAAELKGCLNRASVQVPLSTWAYRFRWSRCSRPYWWDAGKPSRPRPPARTAGDSQSRRKQQADANYDAAKANAKALEVSRKR